MVKEGLEGIDPKYLEMEEYMEKAKKTLSLGDIEYQNAGKFIEEHKCDKKNENGKEKSGYELSFSFGSGIGTKITIKCRACGKKEDITDYEHW